MSQTSIPGKVYQYGQYGTGSYGLILYDFNIGDAALKAEHKAFLDSRIISTILSDPEGIDLSILGFASRRWVGAGNNRQVAFDNNQLLAQDRGYAVYDYILSRLPAGFKLKKSKPVQVYQQNFSVFPEDERERAVSVRLNSNGIIPDIKEIPVSDWTKEFDIKIISSMGVNAPVPLVPGASLGWDHVIFEITNTKGKSCRYKFYDLNMGAGIPMKGDLDKASKAAGSFTPGPPSRFSTKLYMPVDFFYGEAVLMQNPGAAIGQYSVWGSVNLALRPAVFDSAMMFDFKKIDPDPVTISSGDGLQFNPGLNFGFPGKFEKLL